MVFQSYRRDDVPAWIGRCLASVEAWADQQGYRYRFLGDELFDRLPTRYRQRTAHSKQLLADLGRLIVARELLEEGFQRAVWFDADVFVCAPARLVLPRAREFYLCREVWLELTGATVEISQRVNNCVCAFERGASFLPFYIDACQRLVDDTAGALSPLLVGTQFLTALDRALPLPKLENVALLGPQLLRELAAGGGPMWEAFTHELHAPIDAANLCASFRGRTLSAPGGGSFVVDDALFEAAIASLARRG